MNPAECVIPASAVRMIASRVSRSETLSATDTDSGRQVQENNAKKVADITAAAK
jgi:hypothetical protein